MSTDPIDYNETHAIGAALTETTINRARGRYRPYCVQERPQNRYYISNLAPMYGTTDRDDFVSKIQPNNISLDFRPVSDSATVDVEFDVYYPSVPTYKEYQELVARSKRAEELEAAARYRGPTTPADDDDEATTETDGGTVATAEADADDASDADADDEEENPDEENPLYTLDQDFYRRVTISLTFEDVPLEAGGTASQAMVDAHDLAADATDRDVTTVITDLLCGTKDNDWEGAIRRAVREAAAETRAVPLGEDHRPDPEDYPDYDLSDLSPDEFEAVIGDLPTLDLTEFVWKVGFETHHTDDDEMTMQLSNHAHISPRDAEENPSLDPDPFDEPSEPYIFNPKISISDVTLARYEFELLPDDYRFEQHIWTKGHNCSTHADEHDAETGDVDIKTTAIPRSPVYEFDFNKRYDTSFKTLAGMNPEKTTVQALRDIRDGMEDFYNDWRTTWQQDFEAEHTAAEVAEYERSRENFKDEKIRFSEGITAITNDARVRRAFQLMNRVNHRVHWEKQPGEKGFEGWRLFQLVFIVSNIPDGVSQDADGRYDQYERDITVTDEMGERHTVSPTDTAEVLWFPTGGGKTESYLGLILLTLFFDRLRGKDWGVTAWIRFPLRLLSRQQKDRFVEALLEAEQFRRTDEPASLTEGAEGAEGGLGDAGEPFSLGHFVGGNDTPNDIGGNNNLDATFRDDQQDIDDGVRDPAETTLYKQCQQLETCPLCESEVVVRYDTDLNSVFHVCTGDDCIGEIPLYVIDRDIYRRVPSVLLGSLDKIAVLGMNRRFANLLGNLTTYCPDHGWGYSGKCSETHICNYDDEDLFEVGDEECPDVPYDPVPTWHLIDEVHLLNEELGAFASHYETLLQTLYHRSHGKEPKVITSTATIAEYNRQIKNLFQKYANRFPEEGPELGKTFYGEYDRSKVEREYLGITPSNRTHLYSVLDFIKLYHEAIRDYYAMSPAELAIEVQRELDSTAYLSSDLLDPAVLDADRQAEILDLYETSLVYFTNKREKDTYKKNIEKQINDEIREEGYAPPLVHAQLTADTEDTRLIEELQHPEGEFEERIDTVPATSFIGHGIDVDRFNFMLFFGFPSQTFQYIQASSRVGRQPGVPGVVADIFRPFDKRDRNRYKYFEKHHQYLQRTVEPVPIDRWAKFAIKKTFPGMMMAIIHQYYRPTLFLTHGEIAPKGGDSRRVNTDLTSHMREVLDDDVEFPEMKMDILTNFVRDAYGLDLEVGTESDPDPTRTETRPHHFEPTTHFDSEVTRLAEAAWDHWDHSLERNDQLTFERDHEDGTERRPMYSLRDIGIGGHITAFKDNQGFIKTLETN